MVYPPGLKIGSVIYAADGEILTVTGERLTPLLDLRELRVVSEKKSEHIVIKNGAHEEMAPVVDEWVWQWSLIRARFIGQLEVRAKK